MQQPRWIFGYGSLIWRQDFDYLDARRAHVVGWTRRFWQGSHDHRGVADDPGRVLTLVPSAGEPCHGRAFLVAPSVFEHLDYREKNGYQRQSVTVHLPDETVQGITYVALQNNSAYLGPAPVADMVRQIRRCRGQSGPNAEYVIELDSALRRLGIDDPHVAEIASRLELEMNHHPSRSCNRAPRAS